MTTCHLTDGEPGVTNRVTHLVYSHHHSDHSGAASLLGGDVVRVGHEEARRLLVRHNNPARPAPEVTFADRYTTTFAIMQSLRLDRGPSGPVHPDHNAPGGPGTWRGGR